MPEVLILILVAILICIILGVIAFARTCNLYREIGNLKQQLAQVRQRLFDLEDKFRQHRERAAPRSAHEPPVSEEDKPAVAHAPLLPGSVLAASRDTGKPTSPQVSGRAGKPPRPAALPGHKSEHEPAVDGLAHALHQAGSKSDSEPAPALLTAKMDSGAAGESFESVVGKRWMTWCGVAILFFSSAFFLKYAFENDLIGPTGQVALCALAGIAVLVAGTRFLARSMRALGQGLLGLGLAVLYVTFAAAASSVYEPPVLTQAPAFLLLVVVTICGMTLSVLHNASLVAILGILGGLATPLLVSTGHNSRDALFIYLMILDLGVFGVAFFRNWRALDSIAVVGTCILYGGWYSRYFSQDQLTPSLAWLGAFYLVFLALPFVFHFVRQTAVTLERFLLALANAVFAFGFCWHMLHQDNSSALGFIAVGMSAVYVVLGVQLRRRLPTDSRSMLGVIALAVTFLTLAFPLHLHAHGIILAWAVEGPVLLYLGYRFSYQPVRFFGGIVLMAAVIRLLFWHWPDHHGLFVLFANRKFISAITVPAAMGVYAWLHQRFAVCGNAADRVMKIIFALCAGLLLLAIIHNEVYLWMSGRYNSRTAMALVCILWSLGVLVHLWAGKITGSLATWLNGLLTIVVAVVCLCICLWEPRSGMDILFLNPGFLAGVLLTVCVFIYAWVVCRAGLQDDKASLSGLGKAVWGAGIFLLFCLLSYEVPSFVDRNLGWSAAAARMSLTLTWGIYAAGLLVVGFWRKVRALRYCALALFGLSALKLLLVDMSRVEDLLRIVSFMVVGALMLAASYLYHRFEKRFSGLVIPPASEDGESSRKENDTGES